MNAPTPDDAKRKLRRFAARLGATIGKRISHGSIRTIDTLYDATEAVCEAIIESTPKVRGLILAAHDLPRDAEANVVALMVSDVIQAVQRFGVNVRGWHNFRVHDRSTWPNRRGA